eukprot:1660043-Amphidinium_carterae.1
MKETCWRYWSGVEYVGWLARRGDHSGGVPKRLLPRQFSSADLRRRAAPANEAPAGYEIDPFSGGTLRSNMGP